jgi:hypothetical protein
MGAIAPIGTVTFVALAGFRVTRVTQSVCPAATNVGVEIHLRLEDRTVPSGSLRLSAKSSRDRKRSTLPLAIARSAARTSPWRHRGRPDLAVLSQNLGADILMMQPTQNCDGCDGAEFLRAPKIRRILVQ